MIDLLERLSLVDALRRFVAAPGAHRYAAVPHSCPRAGNLGPLPTDWRLVLVPFDGLCGAVVSTRGVDLICLLPAPHDGPCGWHERFCRTAAFVESVDPVARVLRRAEQAVAAGARVLATDMPPA